MDITFNVPHAFHRGSPPDGDADARRILHDCLVRLNHAKPHGSVETALYRIDGCHVVFTLPGNIFHPGATYDDNAYALRCLLDCLTELNVSYLTYCKGVIPTLYKSPVYYKRTEIWDTLPGLYKRGYGDCKSLTAALLSQYEKQGIECAPVFRFRPRPDGSGALDFHILVQTAKGFEDPSKVKGMGANEVASFNQSAD